MWNTLTWHDLETPAIAGEVADLREGMLRLFLGIAAVTYLVWHFTITSVVAPNADLPYWKFFPLPIIEFGGTYLLLQRRSRLATGFFLVSSIISITAAIWFLRSAR